LSSDKGLVMASPPKANALPYHSEGVPSLSECSPGSQNHERPQHRIPTGFFNGFTAAGLLVWFDENDIPPGGDIWEHVLQGLDESATLVIGQNDEGGSDAAEEQAAEFIDVALLASLGWNSLLGLLFRGDFAASGTLEGRGDGAFLPFGDGGLDLGHEFGFVGSEVFRLADVGGEVVELGLPSGGLHKFPGALTDGVIALWATCAPEKTLVRQTSFFTGKIRNQIHAIHGTG
jgi:hypothetical protein